MLAVMHRPVAWLEKPKSPTIRSAWIHLPVQAKKWSTLWIFLIAKANDYSGPYNLIISYKLYNNAIELYDII